MLRIVDRYVLKECALTTLAVIAVLLFILLGNSFVRVLGNIAEGKLADTALWPMLAINMIHYLVILVPLGLYLGILLGMGRFYRDSEMAALFASGIGILRLYRPLYYLAILIALFSSWLVFYLAPWAAGRQDALKHQAEHQSELAGMAAGQFNQSGDGKQTLFFESFDSNHSLMQQVFLHIANGAAPMVQLAETAVQLSRPDENPYLVFMQGRGYSGTPGQMNYRITEFGSYGLRIRQKESSGVALRISSLPLADLWRNRAGPQQSAHTAELHWRFAAPLSCLVLAVMALPLSHTSPRRGKFAKLGIGILVYIVYSNLIGLGRLWLERDTVPSWAGLWWVHFIFITGTVLLVMRQEKMGLFAPRAHGKTL
ncbi:MAG TPA: LPS export ABC transporter permease LptF [Gammaproteobacteria bacterium]